MLLWKKIRIILNYVLLLLEQKDRYFSYILLFFGFTKGIKYNLSKYFVDSVFQAVIKKIY